MENAQIKNIATFALVASIVAVVIALYALFVPTAGGVTASANDADLDARMDQAIERYVARVQKEQQAAQDQEEAARTGGGAPVEGVSVDDDAVHGDKNAPVTLIEFSDYQCPYCQKFFTGALPQIVQNYIDTGKVKLVYRDFPLGFHENARPSAIAAECFREQKGDEGYFQYHNLLFANINALGSDNLKKWAVDLGADANQFNACLDGEKYGSEVDKDIKEGMAYGVSGTPAFFVNGRFISGAQPFEVFQRVIDEELNK
ncbi:DsbA family protein [Candidatus Peregrinibacteria bacterium]|nr:MAG: DsbA family protein [Candidatus Peregrinibacteria bacterium]